jgi:hypothetical protein
MSLLYAWRAYNGCRHEFFNVWLRNRAMEKMKKHSRYGAVLGAIVGSGFIIHESYDHPHRLLTLPGGTVAGIMAGYLIGWVALPTVVSSVIAFPFVIAYKHLTMKISLAGGRTCF